MNLPPRTAPVHVPVLTEVIEVPEPGDLLTAQTVPEQVHTVVVDEAAQGYPAPSASPVASTAQAMPRPDKFNAVPLASEPMMPRPIPVLDTVLDPTALRETVLTPPALDEAQISQRVLAEVQRQIDGMLEFRLREAMAPILARTADALVRELRDELSRTMSDVVSRAVTQELARQRPRH